MFWKDITLSMSPLAQALHSSSMSISLFLFAPQMESDHKKLRYSKERDTWAQRVVHPTWQISRAAHQNKMLPLF